MIASVITAEGSILFSNLADVGERRSVDVEPLNTAVGDNYLSTSSAPVPVVGLPIVGVNDTKTGFIEKLGSSFIGQAEPFGDLQSMIEVDVSVSSWYNNAHLARFEMPWQDLGSVDAKKNFMEVRFTIERASRGYFGIYCETDEGKRSRQGWRGLVHPKEKIIAPINLMGRKIRVVVVAVLFNDARLMLRDASIGYVVGGVD